MYNVSMRGKNISLILEQIPYEFPRTQLYWSAEEDALLWGYYVSGMSIAELAVALLRRPREIRRRLFQIGMQAQPVKDLAIVTTWSGRSFRSYFVPEAL